MRRSAWVTCLVWALWCGLVGSAWDQGNKCQRTPLDTSSPRVKGDNGYKIMISGNPEKYVPGEVYTVSLQGWRTQYSVQKFTGFMLAVEPLQSQTHHYGPQSVGNFQLYGDVLTMHSNDCPNAVVQTSSITKSEIQVLWTAPPAGSGCVVFRATVVENRDQWYMDDGQLTRELCEEIQDSDDNQPEIIHDCCACDEAKYEVTFEGLWSRHTHPKDFPSYEWLTHFSDIIGASHSANYRVWEYQGYSSDGLRQVAEWGSTRILESELKRQSDHIRTIIKARGLWYPNVTGKTFAVFRVDNRHHLMSLVSMLGPSPDWIVGVSGLELCLRNCSWVDQKTLNLYPWDAGTDSGVTYESANSPSIPREKIRRITNSHPNNPESPFYDPTGLPMKPLARLTITRQRVYEKSCSDRSPLGGIDFSSNFPEEDEDDVTRPECQVGTWSLWTQCSVTCGKGLRHRSRTYVMPMKASMMDCHRQLEESEMCAAAEPFCPGGSPFGFDDRLGEPFNPRICATTEWGQWSHCSATLCGKGHRRRSRRYHDRMGRKKCNEDTVQTEPCMAEIAECSGAPEEEIIEPHCMVTEWGTWTPCSVTCGQGTMKRTRYYLSSERQSECRVNLNQVQSCFGDKRNCTFEASDRDEVCNLERKEGPCRAHHRKWYFDPATQSCKEFRYGGCKGNRNRFNNIDDCMEACGMVKGGPPVTFYPNSASSLSNPRGIDPSRDVVDCIHTRWTEFSPCSATCGKAYRTRTRMIKVQPQNGGKKCPRRLFNKQKCDLPKCNVRYGGLESMSLTRENPVENAAPATPYHTPQEPRGSLYKPYEEYSAPALFNPPPFEEHTSSRSQSPIYLHGPPEAHVYDDGTKADCVTGEWGPWSPCTQSCGTDALQQRSRTIIVSPRNGGTQCGDRFQRRYCTLPPCPHTRTNTWDYQYQNIWNHPGAY